MSYDLEMFSVPAGADAGAVFIERAERYEQTGQMNPGPPDPQKEKRKREIIDAILSTGVPMEVCEKDFAALASADGISIEDARARYRDVQLMFPGDEGPLIITVNDDSVSLNVSYHEEGEQARKTWTDIWRMLVAIQRAGGYTTYDNQLGRTIDLDADFDKVAGDYGGTSARLPELLGIKKRPWWKFWKKN